MKTFKYKLLVSIFFPFLVSSCFSTISTDANFQCTRKVDKWVSTGWDNCGVDQICNWVDTGWQKRKVCAEGVNYCNKGYIKERVPDGSYYCLRPYQCPRGTKKVVKLKRITRIFSTNGDYEYRCVDSRGNYVAGRSY